VEAINALDVLCEKQNNCKRILESKGVDKLVRYFYSPFNALRQPAVAIFARLYMFVGTPNQPLLTTVGVDLASRAHEMRSIVKNVEADAIEKTGWLYKCGHYRRKPKKRFFILVPRLRKLRYFVSQSALREKGSIDLNDVSIVRIGTDSEASRALRGCVFELITSQRVFLLSASVEWERKSWIDAILPVCLNLEVSVPVEADAEISVATAVGKRYSRYSRSYHMNLPEVFDSTRDMRPSLSGDAIRTRGGGSGSSSPVYGSPARSQEFRVGPDIVGIGGVIAGVRGADGVGVGGVGGLSGDDDEVSGPRTKLRRGVLTAQPVSSIAGESAARSHSKRNGPRDQAGSLVQAPTIPSIRRHNVATVLAASPVDAADPSRKLVLTPVPMSLRIHIAMEKVVSRADAARLMSESAGEEDLDVSGEIPADLLDLVLPDFDMDESDLPDF
jgi:hypothetical protein